MKILVLAGGHDQIALIQELKARGHSVILADYLDDPPAKPYADKHFQISTLDEERIAGLASEQSVDMVTTACTDQALLTAARVSEKLGLPFYLSSGKALQVTNKLHMKRVFSENGIPTAPYCVLNRESDWKTPLERLSFPLVVKPCDCNSSKGVVRADNAQELKKAVDSAFALSRSGNVIVEEYMEGSEISIDVWADSTDTKVLSVSQTMKTGENRNFAIFQSRYPVSAPEDQIRGIARAVAEAFGLRNCPLLIQAMICKGKVFVIEFSARMGGGSKYRLIEYMSGVNIMKMYVDMILGETALPVLPAPSEKAIELNYVYAYNGVAEEITGLPELKIDGVIQEYFLYKRPGAAIEKRSASSDRIFGFLISADSPEKLAEKRAEALRRADIKDHGKSIMYTDCFK